MITAIMFGSAARRCSGENIIFRYQMTVLVEALFAETILFEDSRRCFSCGVRELKPNVGSRGDATESVSNKSCECYGK